MSYYDIKNVGGHVVIVDQYGRFVSSADNESEALNDIKNFDLN